jgi:hypothetical protein
LFIDWVHDLAVRILVNCDFVFFFLSNFPVYVFEQAFVPHFEILVRVDVFTVGMAYFSETVHIELTDKGAEVAVFEVFG